MGTKHSNSKMLFLDFFRSLILHSFSSRTKRSRKHKLWRLANQIETLASPRFGFCSSTHVIVDPRTHSHYVWETLRQGQLQLITKNEGAQESSIYVYIMYRYIGLGRKRVNFGNSLMGSGVKKKLCLPMLCQKNILQQVLKKKNYNLQSRPCLPVKVSPCHSLFPASQNVATTTTQTRFFCMLAHSAGGSGEWIPVEMVGQGVRILPWKFQPISSTFTPLKKPKFSSVWHGSLSRWLPFEHSGTKMGSLEINPVYWTLCPSLTATLKFHLNTFQYSVGGAVMLNAITYGQDCILQYYATLNAFGHR